LNALFGNQKKFLFWLCAALAVAGAIALAVWCVSAQRTAGWPTVCLDPGHGGKDLGALSSNGLRREKDDNLAIALAVRELLEPYQVRVLLTREEDEFVSLEKRRDLANRKKANLFLSLHRNSSDSGGGGVEIWIHSQNPAPDRALAQLILWNLGTAGVQADRGVKTGYRGDKTKDYFVNRETEMPSCLVELGFVTDDRDNALFDENFDKYAQAIAGAVMTTLKLRLPE
jgi:N-acetylmuramoyl-L-alanine amidase